MVPPPDDDNALEIGISDKAQLDREGDDQLGGGDSSDKVELDLEDAPFLEEDEEEEEEAAPEPMVLDGPDPDAAQSSKSKKKLVLIIAAVLLVLIGAGAAYMLLVPKADPVDQSRVVEPQPEQLKPEEPPEPEDIITSWDPFWVEHMDENGKVRFLICRFAVVTTDEKLAWESGRKKMILRDAIFYYLRNKELTFLADKGNVEVLKKDLLAVINQYLSTGQMDELLIEEYLVK